MEPRAWRLIKNSTRSFTDEARRIPGFSFADWLHGYVYMRWPYLYIGIGTGEHWIARRVGAIQRRLAAMIPSSPAEAMEHGTFAEDYHGKVVPTEAASQLVTVQQDVTLTDLEHVIPYSRAREIVLQSPDHIVALECPCRVARADPCLPLDVCLIVGEPFAGFVKEHHPGRSRWITQGEAVEILRAEQDRGHVSHAFFKDAMLGRFYAICNCCSCCCGAMQYHSLGVPMLASSGFVCQIDTDVCTGCGRCAELCQFGALAVEGGVSIVDADACMGCGVCKAHCESGAASLVRDPSKSEPLEIQKLVAQAAQLA
jgi:ferredoxin